MRTRLVFGHLLAAAALTAVGCGETQVSHDNRRLIESVLTAVSAKNDEWLAANAKLVEARKAEGKMTDSEFEAFRAVLDLGREGRWDEASTRIYALREGQRTTGEDLTRVESGAVAVDPPRPAASAKTRVVDARPRRG